MMYEFRNFCCLLILFWVLIPSRAWAQVGDPQLQTDDPWYPGELSCSSFPRLFKTEAALYKRLTGRTVESDEDKALAAWCWRNTHYWHGEEGQRDCFGAGFRGEKSRDYWTGLFADGFALCGTTHAQWCAEMEALLGHCRARVVGVAGHNSFEVFLTGGAYGQGSWALLDHDVSTVIYDPAGSRLLPLKEIVQDPSNLANPRYKPQRQHGWYVSGLHDEDARGVYTQYHSAEYLAGYAGPPPVVHLRKGEALRRYLEPGLEDGKTFVFWGANLNVDQIPGPSRDRTWVNQADKIYGSKSGTGAKMGRVRYANAVYTYKPNFEDASYRQGIVNESTNAMTFEFYSPYVIAATPPNNGQWGIYDAGGTNGLVIHGNVQCPIQVSVDQGRSWQDCGALQETLDLTDRVKGYQQYLLRFGAGATALKKSGLWWRTVCQANVATIPHLHDGQNTITYLASGEGLIAAGPTQQQAEAHVVEGAMGTRTVSLNLAAPRGRIPTHLYTACWQASGNPPAPVAYRIDFSTDGGTTWQPVVKDWRIERRPPEPPDFWSQSFTWGDVPLRDVSGTKPIRVRFANDGGKTYRKVEAYLAYDGDPPGPAEVTFSWTANGAQHTSSRTFASAIGKQDSSWRLDAGEKVQSRWVEIKAD